MNATLDFKIGDLVYSSIPDSPQMKIEGFKNGMAICVWFNATKVLQRELFLLNTLRTTEIDFKTDSEDSLSWLLGR